MVVKPDNVREACIEILKKYGEDADRIIRDTSKDVSRKSVSELKSTSPVRKGRSQGYARNWTHKKEIKGHSVKEIVYNRKPTYRVAHLLDNGHVLKNGKYWDGDDHITNVEEKFTEEFLNEVLEKL